MRLLVTRLTQFMHLTIWEDKTYKFHIKIEFYITFFLFEQFSELVVQMKKNPIYLTYTAMI